MDRDVETVPLRGVQDERQAIRLGRPESPPGDDVGVDTGRSDLSHLRVDDL